MDEFVTPDNEAKLNFVKAKNPQEVIKRLQAREQDVGKILIDKIVKG